jgi:hypothetical protein
MSWTFIAREENSLPGFETSETLLLGTNEGGDFKLEPVLIYLVEKLGL